MGHSGIVKGYGQFCPVAVACELLGRRWTPLVVRELLNGGQSFNDLRRGLPRISPTVLSARLRELERAGIVQAVDGAADGRPASRRRYELTHAGQDLRPVIEGFATWGLQWGQTLLDADNLDASLLMWDMRRNVVAERAPRERVVVQFELAGSADGHSRYWLVVDGAAGNADLCLTDPGFAVDLVVRGHVRTMVEYWLGRTEIERAVDAGRLTLLGPDRLCHAFPSWFRRSPLTEARAPTRTR